MWMHVQIATELWYPELNRQAIATNSRSTTTTHGQIRLETHGPLWISGVFHQNIGALEVDVSG